jgi:hypothetical protein
MDWRFRHAAFGLGLAAVAASSFAGIVLAAAKSCTNLVIVSSCVIDGRSWQGDVAARWSVGNGSGRNDMRFEVRPGDTSKWDRLHGHAAERAEISESKAPRPLDKDIWFSFGMMVEPGAKTTSRWLELGQLRPTEDPGDKGQSPAWDQGLDAGDVFRIQIRSLPDQKPLRRSAAPVTLFQDPAFQRGRTYRFVYRLRYSIANGGLEAWRDGVKIVDYRGPLGFRDSVGPYFKFGIYREPAPEPLVVHYYDLHFSDRPLYR